MERLIIQTLDKNILMIIYWAYAPFTIDSIDKTCDSLVEHLLTYRTR